MVKSRTKKGKDLKLQQEKTRIVGLGSALVDILVHESDDFVNRIGYPKGGMTLVDMEELERILSQLSASPVQVPGGSACNTAVGVGCLGGQARFVGKRGNDDPGLFFQECTRKRRENGPVCVRNPASGFAFGYAVTSPASSLVLRRDKSGFALRAAL